MNFKLLSLVLVLSISFGANAVILTNGANVDQKTVKTTYNAVQYLEKEGLNVLALTLHACRRYQGSIPDCINRTPDFDRFRNRSSEDLATAQVLKIADANGNISNETCKVLSAALVGSFGKAPNSAPFFIRVSNPISYKNYFSWDYWFPTK